MIDLLYLCHGRIEFTETTLMTLLANTDWAEVDQFVVYNDAAPDGHETTKLLHDLLPDTALLRQTNLGSPVGVMNHFLWRSEATMFAKIDNDIMVPPNWLGEMLDVMEREPQLDLLGMEAGHGEDRASEEVPEKYGYTEASHIGGVGVMRRRPFDDHPWPRPNGRFGFTEWQHRYHPPCGWINPDLRVFSLDQMPFNPWYGYTLGYRGTEGLQRDWPRYDPAMRFYWDWANLELEEVPA
jgi:hypothetical protein